MDWPDDGVRLGREKGEDVVFFLALSTLRTDFQRVQRPAKKASGRLVPWETADETVPL
jgi:hypothetical protein